jgi:hypothetical protein
LANIITPSTIGESLMYAVKRIEGLVGGVVVTYGTGWVLTQTNEIQGTEFSLLVTNRHVVDGVDDVRILMHTKTGGGIDGGHAFLTVPIDDIFFEKTGPDVALIPFGHRVNEWNSQNPGRGLHYVSLRPGHLIPPETELELDVCEPILMVGCPSGLWDDASGFPLFRRGITASHPAVDFQGRPEFAVDIGVYSGSSGSPIILWESGLLKESKASVNCSPGVRFWLLGMLWGGPRITEKGELVVEPAPADAKVTVSTHVRMHLGYAIKAREILSLATKLNAQADAAHQALEQAKKL